LHQCEVFHDPAPCRLAPTDGGCGSKEQEVRQSRHWPGML
jgi:hypothetical protein